MAGWPSLAPLVERAGRPLVIEALRTWVAEKRGSAEVADEAACATWCSARLAKFLQPSQRRVFNLTGTVLHTNLGRAVLAEEAIAAAVEAMRSPTTLEYDLEGGARGERDDHIAPWLCRLTGAEGSTAVNNNAAAVLLVLSELAAGREVIVSRGELIEIGGAFRIPDIMARAGCRLVEVGTTNRTHLKDYAAAIGPDTAAIMKVHPSNYAIQGFTKSVGAAELVPLAREKGVTLIEDLGSGTLADLETWGLPHEPTAREAVQSGVDVVTFSGDKLLGGPQAGLIVGRKPLIQRIASNPMKRALRLDKVRLAALEATLRLYADPARLAERLPTIRNLARPAAEIRAVAERLLPAVRGVLGERAQVGVVEVRGQIGSGALPVDLLPSFALAIRAKGIDRIADGFRALPIPVIGRIADATLHFDLRTLDDEAAFVAQLDRLDVVAG
ncbi:L-seryl-tRNA(Sec) selenium transferase [Reyranella aquatilis]|uniref:L-seryl-tRNA(Sec) selenium transferase n=1 Tax=Reyranella aquatilis TaxID=2035356 RepID=A0ABS8KR21_9HYPH|nr:L-seryl-tRNA(Sec) selenium transferase [Reyranella aquatilis]MCC8428509.1 L-seryl-tRNA(Sec) selenium transferase [Reyranella aquatilis]